MKLDEVMDEVSRVMETITGLRVVPTPNLAVTPPAGYVSYPESIDYDQTYGRGEDRIVGLPIILLIGRLTEQTTRDTVAAWSGGDGAQSVKRAMEAHAWTSCDDLTVTSCKFDAFTEAGVSYLAAIFEADAVGAGTD